jgi:hypothetical protein
MQHGKSDSRPELRNLVPISMSVGWELSNRTPPRAVDRIETTRMTCANSFIILLFVGLCCAFHAGIIAPEQSVFVGKSELRPWQFTRCL